MRTHHRVSVVIVSYNEGAYLRRTIKSLLPGLEPDDEIIVVDDCSTDGSADCLYQSHQQVVVLRGSERLGTVKARNFGAEHSQGDIVVFSDAHIQAPRRWVEPLLEVLAQPTVGAVGPVISMMYHRAAKGYGLRFRDAALNCEWGSWQGRSPHPVPLLGAGFMAMRRDLFMTLGGFDTGMITYGMEDPDLDLRLWTFGYECLLVPTVDVAHLFRNDHPFQDWDTFLYNMLRFGMIHFGPARMERLVACYIQDSAFPSAATRLTTSDTWLRRKEIQALRRYDDDWYFQKFDMP